MTSQSAVLKLIQVLQCYMFPESGRQETLQIPTYNLTYLTSSLLTSYILTVQKNGSWADTEVRATRKTVSLGRGHSALGRSAVC